MSESSTVRIILSRIYILAAGAAIILSMIYGESILVPIILGIVIAFVIDDITLRWTNLNLFGRNLPTRAARIMAIVLIFVILAWVTLLGIGTGAQIAEKVPEYRENLIVIIDQVPDNIWTLFLGESTTDIEAIFSGLFELATEYVTNYISTIASNVLNLLVQAFVIFFYVLFLVSEQSKFSSKLSKMFLKEESNSMAQEIVSSIAEQSRKYISVKTYVSALTGLGSFFVMLLFGVDFPIFWATLIFLFNYIPYVGSIVAVVFPVTIALLQFGNLTTVLFLLVALVIIQVLVGYIFEPIIMGNSLDISSFVVLVSLSLFGTIWGIVGMIIAIPLVIILIIVLGHFETTRPVAILLTGNGELSFEEP
ncbi:MAG: AI-2E family transporter [Chloroflexota bacterium]